MISLMQEVIYKRRQYVDHSYPSYAEDQKTFCTDPAVQIQKISTVIPPFHSSGQNFHDQRSQIFKNPAENHGGKKFSSRVFSQPVQQCEDQNSAAAINGDPGTV